MTCQGIINLLKTAIKLIVHNFMCIPFGVKLKKNVSGIIEVPVKCPSFTLPGLHTP